MCEKVVCSTRVCVFSKLFNVFACLGRVNRAGKNCDNAPDSPFYTHHRHRAYYYIRIEVMTVNPPSLSPLSPSLSPSLPCAAATTTTGRGPDTHNTRPPPMMLRVCKQGGGKKVANLKLCVGIVRRLWGSPCCYTGRMAATRAALSLSLSLSLSLLSLPLSHNNNVASSSSFRFPSIVQCEKRLSIWQKDKSAAAGRGQKKFLAMLTNFWFSKIYVVRRA